MTDVTALWTVVVSVQAVFGGAFDWFLQDVYGGSMTLLAEWLGISMLSYGYMQRAFLAVVLIGVVCPLVGSFLVHRNLSMIGDTLAHTAFAGVAVGLFVNSMLSVSLSPMLTALVVAVGAALLIETLIDRTNVNGDASLAVVLTGGFALGSVLITATDGGLSVGINAYLFGSLSTVSAGDVGILIGICAAVCAVVAVAYRPLVFVTFDPTAARAARIPVGLYNRLLVVLTAMVVVSAMQIMGVILVAALLVIPVLTASGPARSFATSIALGMGAAVVAGIAGVGLAYQFGLAAGGSIVLAAIGVYALVLGAERAIAAFGSSDSGSIRTATGSVTVDADDGMQVAVDGGDEPHTEDDATNDERR